jgi:leader peptidase (prepilin peptidase)/N-methyltransferase
LDTALITETLRVLWLAFGVVVGASLGSFANVVVWRVPRGLSIVHPGSRCPACGKDIPPWNNLPVASWLVLRGRARCCGVPISPRYVLVEVTGAVLGLMVVGVFGPGVEAAMHGVALLLVVCAALIDLDTWTIPMPLSLGLIPLGLVGRPLAAWVGGAEPWQAIRHESLTAVAGAALGFGILAVTILAFTWLFRKVGRIKPDEEAMGWGDAHLLAGVGAWLGAGSVMWVLCMAAAQGSLWALAVAVLPRRADASPEGDQEPPSGPGAPAVATAETSTPAIATAETSAPAIATTEPSTPAIATTEPSAPTVATAEPSTPAIATTEPSTPAIATTEPSTPAVATAETSTPAVATTDPGTPAVATAEPIIEDDWTPPRGAIPFGPLLALAAVEYLFLGHMLPGLDLSVFWLP